MKDEIPDSKRLGILALILITLTTLIIISVLYYQGTQGKIIQNLTIIERIENDIAFTRTRLWDIAYCESNWTVDAQNPVSSASGFWQFIDSTAQETHKRMTGEDLDMSKKNDYQLQKDMAIYLAETDGLGHWECNKLI